MRVSMKPLEGLAGLQMKVKGELPEILWFFFMLPSNPCVVISPFHLMHPYLDLFALITGNLERLLDKFDKIGF